MADAKTNQPENRTQAVSREKQGTRGDVQRWGAPQGWLSSPFELMDRMSEEMDRAFNRMFRDFGVSRGMPRLGALRGWGGEQLWSPRIEAFQKGDQFIVRAELPGMKKDDVHVELTDDALTLQGERHQEREEQREGMYHTEREYGRFYRTIPLPEGVIGESAKASFRDGVLEVTMQAAPAEANRGRRLEITEGTEKK
jgi:HSP20 family protein